MTMKTDTQSLDLPEWYIIVHLNSYHAPEGNKKWSTCEQSIWRAMMFEKRIMLRAEQR